MNADILNQHARDIFDAAVAAAKPSEALRRFDASRLDDVVASARRTYVIGFGKASAAMARAVEDVTDIQAHAGAVIIPRAYLDELPEDVRPQHIDVLPGGHPKPTEEGLESTRRILSIIDEAGPDDVVIVLISGGGSALFADFAEGISLDDAQKTFDLLLESGAAIDAINTVRKHISGVSGGRLAAAIHPARSLSLVISDVPGDSLSVIASGPTVADSTTYENAIEVVERFDLMDRLPESVRDHLQAGARGEREESVKKGDERLEKSETVVIAGNRGSLEAAADKARELGYRIASVEEDLEGEASDVGREFGRRLVVEDVDRPTCWLRGGETTVTLGGSDGKGGRNQELALAAGLELKEKGSPAAVLSGGTDGIDGPTDAAGAVITSHGDLARRADEAGRRLDRHDVYGFLRDIDALVCTGPTHTNVMDVVIGLKHP